MDFVWPEFSDVLLDGSTTWSATFDSFDRRADDCYYVVTVHDGDRETAQFMVRATDGRALPLATAEGCEAHLHGVLRDRDHRRGRRVLVFGLAALAAREPRGRRHGALAGRDGEASLRASAAVYGDVLRIARHG